MPKAGPKKRRAKTEAELIQKAIDENAVRLKGAKRKSGKVRAYTYKDVPKPSPDAPAEQWVPYIREQPEFLAFEDSLSDDERPNAVKLFCQACDHPPAKQVLISYIPGGIASQRTNERYRCERCGLGYMGLPSRTATLKAEWRSYCPQGFDMFEWEDLFTRDKSMWRFIIDEAEFELVKDVLEKGDI